MRVRSLGFVALAAAASTLAPAAVQAQGFITLDRYTVSGCVDWTVRYEPPSTPVRGRVACFGGFADLQLLVTPSPDGPLPNLRFAPTITAEFGPEFAGAGAYPEGANFRFAFATLGGGTGQGYTQTFGGPLGAWTVGSTAPASFTTTFDPIVRDALLGTIRDVRGEIFLRYPLPGSPGPFSESVTVALTLTPCPSRRRLSSRPRGCSPSARPARRRRA
jgi:hypothetical protein